MLVFLDLNGVINQKQEDYIDENCVKNVCDMVKMLKAEVVLTSVLRTGYMNNYNRCSPMIQKVRDSFQKHDVTISGRTIKGDSRYGEIQAYISNALDERYIIIDDDKSLFPSFATSHIYYVDPEKGFTEDDCRKVRFMHVFAVSEENALGR